ncbi:guanylate-binding protein 1-like isoform X2 [Protopterus annectens]|uniref:guanylate-binding protein 1-like isoform X2 n=1 Tax=Protopterus annectens TaxID=7888 RepID=UPI001CF9F704|nr:guanylate-binding protein 1-like isoform X2 [Protopterus annectens]
MEPICLVETTPSGGLRVNDAALAVLNNIRENVQVVSIFGPKGTGKSYLMNMIAETPKGFLLSLPGGPCTEGIWMLCCPHPTVNGRYLVLLDIEGFDPEKGDFRKETMLFILAILLSSVFIYNTQVSVVPEELEKLIYIRELPCRVRADPDEELNMSLLCSLFPQFIWCSRDTILDLKMGEELLSPQNYLEEILQTKKGDGDSPVELIDKLFPNTRLFDLCEPCPGIEPFCLESVPEEELAFLFKNQLQKLRKYIFSREAKTITGGRNITGQMLASLANSYINCLDTGNVILLNEVFETVTCEEDLKEMSIQSCQPPEDSIPIDKGVATAKDEPGTSYRSQKYESEEEKAIKCASPSSYLQKLERVTPVKQSQNIPSSTRIRVNELERVTPVKQSQNIPSSTRIRVNEFRVSESSDPIHMEEPICLITNSASGELQVNQEAMNILSGMQHPVVVVAIAGLYRTGKSYLMNKLAGKQKGFSLGSTVQSHTKGIWMWCVPHPLNHNQNLVLLDTEGLGDVEKGNDKNDCWIFALAVLLSSTFVYNSMATIDQSAVDKLHYVTELTECIKVKSHSNEDDSMNFARFFPAFVWAVRDFTLELVVDEKPITEDEYLDTALKLKTGNSKEVRAYNMPRECIRNYFPSRKCFVFERPASTAEKLRKLEELTEDELEATFVRHAEKFCQHIFNTAQTKTLKGGHIVTGTLLGNLAVTYVDAIRSGAIPCMENAVVALAQIENSAAVRQGHEHYIRAMEKRAEFPTETLKEISELHAICEKEAIQVFMTRSFKDDDQTHQKELKRIINLSYEQFCRKNEQASIDKCTAVILDAFQNMEDQITAGYYSKPGGYCCFMEDQKKMIETYNAYPGKGIKAEEVLKDFLKDREEIAYSILKTDQTLTDKQKEVEAERMKSDAAERENIAMKENQKALQQMIQDQDRGHKEHVQQLTEKMEQDRQNLMKEQERVLNQKLQEQRAMLENGFRDQANRLEREIQALRQETRQTRSRGFCSVM